MLYLPKSEVDLTLDKAEEVAIEASIEEVYESFDDDNKEVFKVCFIKYWYDTWGAIALPVLLLL